DQGEGMIHAYNSYNVFRRSFDKFREVMECRSVGIAQGWSVRVDLPSYISWEGDGDIEVVVFPGSIFYGFREFSRVKRCALERCSKYFLVTRTGQIYCTDSCGTKARVQRHKAKGKKVKRGGK